MVVHVRCMKMVSDCVANIMVSDGSSDWGKIWSCTYSTDGVVCGCFHSINDAHIIADIRQKGTIMQHCEKSFLSINVGLSV